MSMGTVFLFNIVACVLSACFFFFLWEMMLGKQCYPSRRDDLNDCNTGTTDMSLEKKHVHVLKFVSS